MEFLDSIMVYLQPGIDWLMPGLMMHAGDGSVVDWMTLGIQMGVIAFVLTMLMREFGAILIFTVLGVIIHVIVDIVMPMVRGGADASSFDVSAFTTQLMTMPYLQYLAALAVGYILMIIVLSILKGIFFSKD
jgi:hypothetical protein